MWTRAARPCLRDCFGGFEQQRQYRVIDVHTEDVSIRLRRIGDAARLPHAAAAERADGAHVQPVDHRAGPAVRRSAQSPRIVVAPVDEAVGDADLLRPRRHQPPTGATLGAGFVDARPLAVPAKSRARRSVRRPRPVREKRTIASRSSFS